MRSRLEHGFAIAFILVACLASLAGILGDAWWLRLLMAVLAVITAWEGGRLAERARHREQ